MSGGQAAIASLNETRTSERPSLSQQPGQTLMAIGLHLGSCSTYGPVVASPDLIATSYASTMLRPGDRIKVTMHGKFLPYRKW